MSNKMLDSLLTQISMVSDEEHVLLTRKIFNEQGFPSTISPEEFTWLFLCTAAYAKRIIEVRRNVTGHIRDERVTAICRGIRGDPQ